MESTLQDAATPSEGQQGLAKVSESGCASNENRPANNQCPPTMKKIPSAMIITRTNST
jgi:hypothetical protein